MNYFLHNKSYSCARPVYYDVIIAAVAQIVRENVRPQLFPKINNWISIALLRGKYCIKPWITSRRGPNQPRVEELIFNSWRSKVDLQLIWKTYRLNSSEVGQIRNFPKSSWFSYKYGTQMTTIVKLKRLVSLFWKKY